MEPWTIADRLPLDDRNAVAMDRDEVMLATMSDGLVQIARGSAGEEVSDV